ncbi:MAG: DUF2892 domain-containing protein [Candidatus Limnocylindrales bacterium]
MNTTTTDKPNWFAASWFGQCLSSRIGRIGRVVAGLALMAGGLFLVGGTVGIVIAAVGLVPLLAGALDVCIFSALFGGPLRGSEVRACAR